MHSQRFFDCHRYHSLGPAYLAHKILPPNMPEELPAVFFTEFISRFADEGFDEVCSWIFSGKNAILIRQILRYMIKTLASFMREQNITTQFQAGLRALAYLTSFKDLAIKVSTFWL